MNVLEKFFHKKDIVTVKIMSHELKKEKYKEYAENVIGYIKNTYPELELIKFCRKTSDWVIDEDDFFAKFLINGYTDPRKIKKDIVRLNFEFGQQGRISDIDIYHRPYQKERGLLNYEIIDWGRYNLLGIGEWPRHYCKKLSRKDK